MVRSPLLIASAIVSWTVLPFVVLCQESPAPSKPTEHLVGTVASADAGSQTVTLKEDGSGLEHVIQLQNTRTLLKVSPGAKDLKAAVRITSSDLVPGDRIDVRGFKVESDPNAVAARSVVLMSSRELQQARQSEASAWQHSTAGTVTALDSANKKITVNVRIPEGTKPVVVDAAAAVLTRYSPENPKTATPSQFADIQPGDQVKIIGDRSEDGNAITAQKIYSGTFKTMAGTVSSISPDGKSLVVKDLATKQNVTVSLSDESGMHKLPPMMAMMLARRFNPDMKNAGAAAGPGGTPVAPGGNASSPGPSSYGAKAGEAGGTAPGARAGDGTTGPAGPGRVPGASDVAPGGHDTAPGGPGGAGPRGRMGSGDLSQLLDRLPKITTADLKNGDAVIVSGSPAAASKSTLLATSVVAGVEPIFQAAPGRQAQSLGDWGASLGAGAAMDAGSPPQ